MQIGHNEEVFSPSTEIEKILVIHIADRSYRILSKQK